MSPATSCGRSFSARIPTDCGPPATAESVTGLDRAALEAFRQKHLVADNAVLAVFGNVDAETVRARVETLFAGMPVGKNALTLPPPSPVLAEDHHTEQFRDKEQAVLMIGYPGTTIDSKDRHALELIDEASSDLGSRFFIRIREELGLAYFVGASQMVGLAPGMFTFYVGTDPLKVELVREAFTGEIAKLAAEGLTELELTRAKKKLLGKQAISYQSNASLAYTAALDELYGLGYLHYKAMAAQLEAVTLAEVREVARRYFHERPSVTVVVRPEKTLAPAELSVTEN